MDFMLLKFAAVIAVLVLIYPRSSPKADSADDAAAPVDPDRATPPTSTD